MDTIEQCDLQLAWIIAELACKVRRCKQHSVGVIKDLVVVVQVRDYAPVNQALVRGPA
jgi:hypothetical protein